MNANLARTLFVRLGGRIAQSLRSPNREVWVIRKPKSTGLEFAPLKRATPVVTKRKNSSKTFHTAWEIMTARSGSRSHYSWA
jgi:hypothetical protein